MPTTLEKLEELVAQVKRLPQARQQLAVEALSDIAAETYELSPDELAVLRPEIEAAGRGEFAGDADVAALLDKPWL